MPTFVVPFRVFPNFESPMLSCPAPPCRALVDWQVDASNSIPQALLQRHLMVLDLVACGSRGTGIAVGESRAGRDIDIF